MSVSAEVATLFLDELARRNISVRLDEDGNYTLDAGGGDDLKVNLENVSRDYEQDRDAGRVTRFVDTITNLLKLPDWPAAEGQVRWQVEPISHNFGDTLRETVSDKVALVLVYADPSETQICWLGAGDAARWNKTREELTATARTNMERILRQTKVETTTIDEHQLGMLGTELVSFKAALLLCPNLKQMVEPVLGWPIFAMMPCRDFVYLLSQNAQPLLGRLGHVVVGEYGKSGYPITTEVFEIGDDGIRAIGDFQQTPSTRSPEPDEDGLKTIHYRGGLVTFRIPFEWTEEYNEDGGGVFYDKDGTGTLRLDVLTFASKTPVTTRTALPLLESRRAEHGGELSDLGHGDALLRYTEEAMEGDESLTIHYWQIANVVPPNHFRLAVFSYTVLTEYSDDDDVTDDVAMIDGELRQCRFAEELGS